MLEIPALCGRSTTKSLKWLDVSIAMGKKLIFLIAMLLVFSLPANADESGLFSTLRAKPIKNQKNAPNVCLEELNGGKVQLAALKGKIIFLNFWATWCGPCREEMPSTEALYQHYQGKDFLFLTICLDDDGREPVKKFTETHRYRIPILLDPAGKTLDLFEISRIPATLIIDRNGRMIGRVIGPRDWSSPEVFSLVDQMLLLHDRPGVVPVSRRGGKGGQKEKLLPARSEKGTEVRLDDCRSAHL